MTLGALSTNQDGELDARFALPSGTPPLGILGVNTGLVTFLITLALDSLKEGIPIRTLHRGDGREHHADSFHPYQNDRHDLSPLDLSFRPQADGGSAGKGP